MRFLAPGENLLEDPMACMACGSALIVYNDLHLCSKCQTETRQKVRQIIKDHKSGDSKKKTFKINILKHMTDRA